MSEIEIGGYKWDLESLSVLSVIPFFSLALLSHVRGIAFRPTESYLIVTLLGDVLFLNTTHIGFAYWQLFSLPEVKDWLSSRTAPQKLKMASALLVVGVLPFAAFMGITYFKTSDNLRELMIVVSLLFTQYLRTQHIVYQHLGLSLLYNVKTHLDPSVPENEKRKLRTSERLERWGFHCFAGTSFLFFLSTQFVRLFPVGIQFYLQLLRMPLQVFLCAIIVFIFSAALWPSRSRSNAKPLFLSRLAFYPMNNWVAAVAIRFFHGVEYLGVYARMQEKSRNPNKRKLPLGLVVCVLAILILLYFRDYPWDTPGLFKKRSLIVAVLAALSFSSAWIHFYLDSVLFEMRDKKTREIIGPLLLK